MVEKLFNLFLNFYYLNLFQEQGDLKLRVRALESERSFQRVAAVQKTIGSVSFIKYNYLINSLVFVITFSNLRVPQKKTRNG